MGLICWVHTTIKAVIESCESAHTIIMKFHATEKWLYIKLLLFPGNAEQVIILIKYHYDTEALKKEVTLWGCCV